MTIREKIRKITVWGCCFILFSCTETKEVIEYVNPFIGTEQVGHTYPGATVPFGMVQLSPDTRPKTGRPVPGINTPIPCYTVFPILT